MNITDSLSLANFFLNFPSQNTLFTQNYILSSHNSSLNSEHSLACQTQSSKILPQTNMFRSITATPHFQYHLLFSFAFICYGEVYDQSNLEKKGCIWLIDYSPSLRELKERTLQVGTKADTTKELCSLI